MEDTEKPTCSNVRDIRLAMGLTQEAFAEKMGVTYHSVQAWEYRHPPAQGKNHKALVRFKREYMKEKALCVSQKKVVKTD